MPTPPRVPANVLEEARRVALRSADEDELPRSAERQRRTKDKVVAALKRLPVGHAKPHPMD
jgi:hypothetical protein